MIPLIIALYFLAGFSILAFGRSLGRAVFSVAFAPFAVTLAMLLWQTPSVLYGGLPTSRMVWVGRLALTVSFRLDGFALAMALLVAVIGALVVLYASSYFAHEPDATRVVRFASFLTLFAGAMLGLVVADDVWTLFTFWELTSVLSFLLIGLDDRLAGARTAALRALLVTGAGGLAMLGGLVCLVREAGTADLHGLLDAAPHSTTAQIGLALVLVGAFAKSAQVPLHFWLPGAMAAPTPVSAFLHSATMVKAGVVIVARFTPAFAFIGWWRPLMVGVGGLTMLVGGVAALRRDDAKQSLAFGTVSQLGLLVVVFGSGSAAATAAGVAMLVAHALFKSGLFLTVGAVEHATGSRSLSQLSGVGRSLPLLGCAAGLCTLSMIGLPPMLGFVAKEAALASLLDEGGWSTVALVAVVVGSVLTAAYSIRLWWGMFGSKKNIDASAVDHRPGRLLVGPVVGLAVLSLGGGVFGSSADGFDRLATSLDDSARLHLTLLPGLHLPLLLSALIVAAGGGIAFVIHASPRTRGSAATLGERAYGSTYRGLLNGARRLTLVTQSGSLPVYVAVVFCVFVAAIGAALFAGAVGDWGHPVLADSVLQGAVAVLAMILSIAVVLARRRFVAVLLLGGVGQGLTVVFLMYGAPDLGLTQFMVETLMVVAFVLVLRHLPQDFAPPPSWAPKTMRIGISVAVGVAVACFALAAGGGDRPTDVTDAMEQLSLPAAGGRNVVNVAIVDFRGVDTMFEISVFAIAALGVANLVTASRRRSGYSGETRSANIGAESMIFEQVTRMIFHVTLLVSIYVALRGHNAPGGGFAGGLIAGAAFVFRLLAGGGSERSLVTRISPITLLASGIMMAVGSGLVSLIVGEEFLETAIVHVDVPLIGDLKLVSASVFDLGVYFLVIGVVILVLSHLASRTHGGGLRRDRVATR